MNNQNAEVNETFCKSEKYRITTDQGIVIADVNDISFNKSDIKQIASKMLSEYEHMMEVFENNISDETSTSHK